MPERGRMRKKVCKVWTVRNRPVNLTPRKRETRDLRIEAPSSSACSAKVGVVHVRTVLFASLEKVKLSVIYMSAKKGFLHPLPSSGIFFQGYSL